MRSRLLAWSLIAALIAPFVPVCRGEPGPVPPIGPYHEHYVENPTSSTTVIVGLRWGSLNGAFDPENVRLRLLASTAVWKVCVDVTSKDGRYEAENFYTVIGALSQPRLMADTAYKSTLERYSIDDLGIVIRQAPSCDESTNGALVPAIVTPLNSQATWFDPHTLVVDLNRQPDLVKATLVSQVGEAIAARSDCVSPAGEINIAYRAVCTIKSDATLLGQVVKLRLTILERYETEIRDIPLSTAQ